MIPTLQKKYVISYIAPSWDGSKVAFAVSPNGSENAVVIIMNIKEMKIYHEKIEPTNGEVPISWTAGNNSILYLKLQSSDVHDVNRQKNSKTFLHTLGTDPAGDREIFPKGLYPELNIAAEKFPIVTYDRETNLLFGRLASVDNRMNVYYAPESELNKPKISWKRLFKPEDEVYKMEQQ